MLKNMSLSEIQRKQDRDVTTWRPIFYRLNDDGEVNDDFQELLRSEQVMITDELVGQLKELIKSRHPKRKMTPEDVEHAMREHVGTCPLESYGVWVYYPWSRRLVHLLDEAEFVEVRTNRNHYKITPEEHDVLAGKRIGLIGLSVGQSVAVTMAMERSFGELRLADFDDLELTNLNRIRTGVHNLGVPKVVAVAREIMEIDPYLKLSCFTEGLTEGNIDRFFTEGGDLDLLIDECDGLDMKVIGRWKARQMKIPVVMEASDRGMVDVERFDLEPQRPLLHGMIEDLDPQKLKSLETNEDKMPYMLDIVGLETISTRAKASMLEIGETITTWPQLASAVTLGGGITADVVRRILLDKYSESGRYYIDVEELIGDGAPSAVDEAPQSQRETRTFAEPDADYGPPPSPTTDNPLTDLEVKSVVEAALHAPSGGNLQPWKWSWCGNVFRLKRDVPLTGGFLDHNQIATHIALGASLENADLALVAAGHTSEVSYFPLEKRPDVIADLEVKNGDASDDDRFLSAHILERHTNRNIDPGPDLDPDHVRKLTRYAGKHGSGLVVVEDRQDLDEIGAVIAFAERFRIMHPEGHRNFNQEMRWTQEEAETSGSGVDLATVDLTVGERAGFQLARNREVIEKLVEWKGGTAFEKLSKKSTGAAAALGILTRSQHDALQHVKAGRDLERVWIGANALGLSFQPQSPITLILQRLSERADLSESQTEELENAKRNLERVLNKYTDDEPVFIFRLFYGKRDVVRSMRRSENLHFRAVK